MEDEANGPTDITYPVDVDLDPVENYLTLINPPTLGDDSTPDIIWELDPLLSEQFMSPTVTTGGSSANSLTVTFDDDTTVTSANGFMNFNGITYEESTLTMNSSNAGNAYWKAIKRYKITAPAMVAGDNSFKINLNCVAV